MSKLPLSQSMVKVSNKEYRVSYPEGQESKLNQASDLLNRRIQTAKNENAEIGTEQTIAITALNLAHELLEQRSSLKQQLQHENDAIKARLRQINEWLDRSLREPQQDSEQSARF